MSITALFVGPQDAESCNGCDDAVDGNPYTIATVPTPGEFECGPNCRHMTQLAEDAPDDIAPYQWNGQFTGLDPGLGDVAADVADEVPAEDVAAGERVAADELGGDEGGGGHGQEPSDDQVSSQLEPTDPDAVAQELWDARLTPDDADVSEEGLRDAWALLLESVSVGELLDLLHEGAVEFLQELDDPIPTMLEELARQGLTHDQAFEAQTLAQVLNKRVALDDVTGHWNIV